MKLKELTFDELTSVTGGGLFKDVGQWCGEAWCTIKTTCTATYKAAKAVYAAS